MKREFSIVLTGTKINPPSGEPAALLFNVDVMKKIGLKALCHNIRAIFSKLVSHVT